MITVVACDDHNIVCAGIARVFNQAIGVTFVGTALTPADLMRQVQDHSPTIVLLDINLGETSGLDLIKPIAAVSPKSKVVLFSMYDSAAYVRRARELGARGYITKDRLDDELIQITREVAASDQFVSSVNTSEPEDHTAGAPLELLTAREFEVLKLLASGMTNAEIASALFLSRRTVESHRARIQIKLQLRTRAELARALLGSQVGEP